jgi:predicted NBD/HSP70 family sugar kinase
MVNSNIKGTASLRQKNKIEIINYIRQYGPVSRTEIYERTNISKSTVTRVVENLVSCGIVEEVGLGENEYAGRKPIYLQLNFSYYCCIGMNISRNTIRASVIDLGKNILEQKKISIKDIKDEKTLLERISEIINSLIKKTQFSIDRVLGIGIGAPGIVNYDEGVLIDFNPKLGIKNIKLKEYLEEIFDLPIYVDNNPNTRVLGEYWYGYGVGYNNIAYIVCDEGIGAGIITDGNILRGKNNITGEFGHMIVDIDGQKCNCGRYGCVEAYCSTELIERAVNEGIKESSTSLLKDYIDANGEKLTFNLVCQFYDKDEICKEVLDNVIRVLSIGLFNLMAILNSDIIILSGELFDHNDLIFEKVVLKTKKYLFKSTEQIEFKKRKTKDYIYEVGAAALVYKDYFTFG